MSSTPSIPPSPPPGKDPPSSKTDTSTSISPPSLPPHAPREASLENPSPSTMAPPPKPPKITTQRASTSNILSHPSLTTSRLRPSIPQVGSQSQSQLESQEDAKPRPPFTPFFTLINDVSAGGGGEGERENTIHPRKIHYIFSDDEGSDLLTSSLINSIHPHSHPSPSASASASQRDVRASETDSSSSATFGRRVKGGQDGKEEREERVVIVDINESGDGVKSVSSLSPAWQVLSASISNAPTFDASPDQNQHVDSERGLMLKIEGVGVDSLVEDTPSFKGKSEGREESGRESGLIGEEEMQGLLEGFDRKMEVLRRVLVSRGSKEDLGVENTTIPGAGTGTGEEKD